MARKVSYQLEKWFTLRDRQLLVSVYNHSILNSRQIEELHFKDSKNSRVIALRRLKKLSDNGFLKVHWYGYNKFGTMQHFALTNKGAMIVASELSIPTESIKINDASIVSNIEHTSLIADFHLNLLRNNQDVLNFTSDKLNRIDFTYMAKNYVFEPDGKGEIITNSGRSLPFYLEMDRGTMAMENFKKKIPNYESYYKSKLYLNEFDVFPLVIVVTSTLARLRRLRKLVEDHKKTDITFLFSLIDEMNEGSYYVSGKEEKMAIN